MTYLLIVAAILADNPLAAVFCIGMATMGAFLLVAGFWPG